MSVPELAGTRRPDWPGRQLTAEMLKEKPDAAVPENSNVLADSVF